MIKKQKVFIPISVNDELPEMDKKVIVLGEQLSSNPQMGGKYPFVTKRQDLSNTCIRPDRLQDDNKFMYARYVSDWLKEDEGYFLTTEEAKNLIVSFLKFHYKENPLRKDKTNERDAEEFIQSLNIK